MGGADVDIVPFEDCVSRLYALSFPALKRPPACHEMSLDEVAWATDVYTFCLLAHLRQLLESFALLVRQGHAPTTFFVGRALFELAGQAMHVANGLRSALGAGDNRAAWDLLHSATMGSRTMRERGLSGADGAAWAAPVHVMDAVRAFAEFFPGATRREREREAEEMYGHLCEFCHPNVGALTQYGLFEERGGRAFFFLRWSPDGKPPVNEVAIATATALVGATELLGMFGNQPTIAAQVVRAREAFLESRHRGRGSHGS